MLRRASQKCPGHACKVSGWTPAAKMPGQQEIAASADIMKFLDGVKRGVAAGFLPDWTKLRYPEWTFM